VDEPTTEAAAVLEVHAAFYSAFEARDLDAMAELWERSERAAVVHPGWPLLRGWPKVLTSWEAIFRNTPYIQFVLTDEHVEVDGDHAWVTTTENILQGGGEGSLHDAAVAAFKLFARRDGGPWRIVMHQGSAVARAD
jgi:ketosteroid isomerase-like protein